jgi:hypothetical protein
MSTKKTPQQVVESRKVIWEPNICVNSQHSQETSLNTSTKEKEQA